MITILCIASEWFSRKGGLSSFNRQLCSYLAIKHKVYCYLPEFAEDEFKDAHNTGVMLIKPQPTPGMDIWHCMNSKPRLSGNDKIDILIGHDRITGPIMEFLRNNYYAEVKTIFFIHTNPGEIELYKPEQPEIDHAAKAEEREKIQKDLAKNSSLIVAVGPKLYYEVSTYMSGIDKMPPIIRFDPGLYEEPNKINYNFSSLIPEALMMGRLEDFHLKGVDIAFKAMDIVYNAWDVEVNNTVLKPNLILRGSPIGKDKELRDKLKGLIEKSKLTVQIRNYSPDAAIIIEDIKRTAVTLMPSRTEGFGLVALEAISLGRPIVVGHKTGFAILIEEIAPEEADNWIVPTDGIDDGVGLLAEKIEEIFRDRKAAGDRLKRFVEIYSSKISWEKSVESLIDSIDKQLKTIFFDSKTSSPAEVSCYGLPIWDNIVGDHVGPKADSDFHVGSGEIKVARKNADGRNMIDIVKYKANSGQVNYIEHRGLPQTDRVIRISFEARVIGDPVNLFVIIHKYKDHVWYRHGWVQIEKKEWQECVIFRKVASYVDFTAQIQEKDFKGKAAVYEIRKYVVEEWLDGLAAGARELVMLDGMRVERHTDYKHRDVPENVELSGKSYFTVKINLHQPDQKFIIYLAIVTSDGQTIWLGFSGGLGTTPGKTKDEYTLHRCFPEKKVAFEVDIQDVFKRGFPELKSNPVRVKNVRLRASDVDLTEITFAYKIGER